MRSQRQYPVKSSAGQTKRQAVQSHVSWSQRARRTQFGARNVCEPFAPPETWHEPTESGDGYRIVVQTPGEGYRHIVTPEQIRQRLKKVPQRFLEGLEVVQLSQMTRKKRSFPCYGMQWGATLYLYPLETSLEEVFYTAPRPEVKNEVKMYGGSWDRSSPGIWRLCWSQQAIEDFYLNNILIHELGHLVDDRNASYTERERFAEWFAIRYGYAPTGGNAARQRQPIRRRHHKK